MVNKANDEMLRMVESIQEALAEGSAEHLGEIFGEMTDQERGFVNAALNQVEHTQIEQLLESAA